MISSLYIVTLLWKFNNWLHHNDSKGQIKIELSICVAVSGHSTLMTSIKASYEL